MQLLGLGKSRISKISHLPNICLLRFFWLFSSFVRFALCYFSAIFCQKNCTDEINRGAFTNYICIFWHFLTMYVPSLHFLCSKLLIFLTTYPSLGANVICESSLWVFMSFSNIIISLETSIEKFRKTLPQQTSVKNIIPFLEVSIANFYIKVT